MRQTSLLLLSAPVPALSLNQRTSKDAQSIHWLSTDCCSSCAMATGSVMLMKAAWASTRGVRIAAMVWDIR